MIPIGHWTVAAPPVRERFLQARSASQHRARREHVPNPHRVEEAAVRVAHLPRGLQVDERSVEEVREALGTLSGEERQAMVTLGSSATAELSLERLGNASVFKSLLRAEDLGASQLAPDGFLKCLAVTIAEAHVFEDSKAGFASARKAGVEVEDARRCFLTKDGNYGN